MRPGEAAIRREVSNFERDLRAAATVRARHLGHSHPSAGDVDASKWLLRQGEPASAAAKLFLRAASVFWSVSIGFLVSEVQQPGLGSLVGLVVAATFTLAFVVGAVLGGWRPQR